MECSDCKYYTFIVDDYGPWNKCKKFGYEYFHEIHDCDMETDRESKEYLSNIKS